MKVLKIAMVSAAVALSFSVNSNASNDLLKNFEITDSNLLSESEKAGIRGQRYSTPIYEKYRKCTPYHGCERKARWYVVGYKSYNQVDHRTGTLRAY